MKLCIILIFLLSQVFSVYGRYPSSLLSVCHQDTCSAQEFNCECEKNWSTDRSTCIPLSSTCDAKHDCEDGSDELDCLCPPDFFQCGCDHGGGCPNKDELYYCIPRNKTCDGKQDCAQNKDEIGCSNSSLFKCSSGEYISKSLKCDGQIDCNDGSSDETNCSSCPIHRPNPCDCNKVNNMTCRKNPELSLAMTCYDNETEICDGRFHCADKSDEISCENCSKDYPNPCDCNKAGNITCTGYQICYEDDQRCNGINDCSDNTDEQNCTKCPKNKPNRCDCNQQLNNTCENHVSCYSKEERCNGDFDCSDESDELNCAGNCSKNEFACNCLKTYPPSCNLSRGCVSKSRLYDGKTDCPDNSDESHIHRIVDCGSCILSVHKLKNITQCHEIGLPQCDPDTCYIVSSEVCQSGICPNSHLLYICTSKCENKSDNCSKIFQCTDGNLFMQYEFCNGEKDCPDGSDETRVGKGFRCANNRKSCILPQNNLHDKIDHCGDGSDLCNDLKRKRKSCFECLDRSLLISHLQVCDNTSDCNDMSDECFCIDKTTGKFTNHIMCNCNFLFYNTEEKKCTKLSKKYGTTNIAESNYCENKKTSDDITLISCISKDGGDSAYKCDGRPECKDFSDECNGCNNSPSFCNDTCHSFYPLGDRYCDGEEDEEAWKYLEDRPNCSKGFDERNCPKRFKCQAGSKVSIDLSQVCDGIKNCNDGSDEARCSSSKDQSNDISSDTEMIKYTILKFIVWAISFITIIGNGCVIYSTVETLRSPQNNLTDVGKCSRILMLNLSCADFLMGIYLLIIAIQSQIYSGTYGNSKHDWQTSVPCSVAGSIAIISSETSCFIMLVITMYRLYNVHNTFNSYASSKFVKKWCIPSSWILAIILAMVPNIGPIKYFQLEKVWFPNVSLRYVLWDKQTLMDYACHLSTLSNNSNFQPNDNWTSINHSIATEFRKIFPNNKSIYSIKMVGYYGESSVCLPRFYVAMGDSTWEYSLLIITINFISFLCIAIGYSLMYYLKAKSSESTRSNYTAATTRSNRCRELDNNAKLQRRIAYLILTDFMCWMPICIMAYIKFAGVELLPGTYPFSAIVLLPINSALNPIIYGKPDSNAIKRFFRTKSVSSNSRSTLETNDSFSLQTLRRTLLRND